MKYRVLPVPGPEAVGRHRASCSSPRRRASYGAGAYTLRRSRRDRRLLPQGDGPRELPLARTRRITRRSRSPGPDTATGIWALEDWSSTLQWELDIHGAAFYEDDYVKRDGEWKILRTTYKRVFEELSPRSGRRRAPAHRLVLGDRRPQLAPGSGVEGHRRACSISTAADEGRHPPGHRGAVGRVVVPRLGRIRRVVRGLRAPRPVPEPRAVVVVDRARRRRPPLVLVVDHELPCPDGDAALDQAVGRHRASRSRGPSRSALPRHEPRRGRRARGSGAGVPRSRRPVGVGHARPHVGSRVPRRSRTR